VPGALIVIEIAAPKVSSDALAVLVSACSRAARDAECVLARNESDEPPAAVAIVTLQSADKMRVEVGVRQGDRDSWRTRDFAFLAADKSMDRWRAVGFAIGTLAESSPPPEEDASVRAAPAPSSPSPESPTTGTQAAASPAKAADDSSATLPAPAVADAVTPAVSTSSEHSRPRGTQLFVGAAVIFGPGLDADPPWRFGSALYGDLAFSRVPVFLTLGGSAATRLGAGAGDVTTRWFDVSLGAGLPLLGPLSGSGLEFRAQVLAEYFDAHASALGRSQTLSRWTLGLQGAFGGRLQIVPDLLLTAEVQAAGLSGETEVVVGGESVGSSANFRYLGSVGLRVRLR
jgi:hypothetical protein